jgi:undecaprenyl-diphosphatase
VSIFQAVILGLTQGVTEFAPISSSGHLIIVPWLFGWPIVLDPALNKTFDVALHLGTLLGAVIYFRHDVVRYLRAFGASVARRRVEGEDQRIALALVVGTIPAAIVGALFESVIEDTLGQPWVIGVMLAVFGVALYVIDRRCRSDRHFDSIGPRAGLYLGVAQALALQPGVSRSGVTMSAARLIGIDREAAARFSFLLALPVIAGAGLAKSFDVARDGFSGYGWEFLAGFVASAVSGFVVIWWMLRYLKRHDYRIFMIYRLAVAIVIFGLIVTGARGATI